MNMDIDEIRRINIRALEAEHGAPTLAKRAEMSLSQFYNLRDGAKDSRTGKPRGMRKETAWKIEEAAGKPRGYLDIPQDSTNISPAAMGARQIPLISCVQAGMWAEIVDTYHPGDAGDWLLTDLDLSEHAFALEVKGESMLPEFRPGDRIIIDPQISPQPGDFVVAKNGEEAATFKKYRPRGVGANGELVFELVPLNDDYPTLRSDTSHINLVGVMVEHRKYRRR